ncbi:MAG: hypothetical protein U0934_09385 [Pseudotabrizicola sp.]|uniref:hypothetical protein n=1 Tax=Pseudotabrizicola sp. TaxID=2939647 RepID=UPI002727B49E|nr:hypothetical protein [Pseudotabrizicola sp.]MDO8883335.1 hypothetical protein [Pseudotabrizicola sp.]MDP2082402.1 hypothetical protein [Pseudotabrizicola sp.]MDZ7574155.1 hypothetical protein [Pseudotabrizicola sp.]
MKWDQIESKWAVMTRRIRADWGDDRIAAREGSVRTLKRRDDTTPGIADTQVFAVTDSEIKTPAK